MHKYIDICDLVNCLVHTQSQLNRSSSPALQWVGTEIAGWEWHYRVLGALSRPIILISYYDWTRWAFFMWNRETSALQLAHRLFPCPINIPVTMCCSCKVICIGDDQNVFSWWDCPVFWNTGWIMFCFSTWFWMVRSTAYALLTFVSISHFPIFNIHHTIDWELDWAGLGPWHAPVNPLCPWWTFYLYPIGRLAGCDYRDRSAKKEWKGEAKEEVCVKNRVIPVHRPCYWKRTQSTRCVGWLYALLLSRIVLLQHLGWMEPGLWDNGLLCFSFFFFVCVCIS